MAVADPSPVAGRPAVVPELPPGRTVELPGRGRTFVRELAGPDGSRRLPLVLLHGWSVTADLNFFTCYGPLADQGRRVVALDHRGHGRGIRPFGGRVRLSDCADDVAALLDVLGIEQAVVLGYSMGGPIAQLTWRRHPDKVGGMVLCATSADFTSGPAAELRYRAFGGLGLVATVAPLPATNLFHRMIDRRAGEGPMVGWMRGELQRGSPGGLLSALGSLGRYRADDWIGEVDVPTSVVRMTEDQTVSPRRQARLAELVPGAERFDVAGPHDVCATNPRRFVPVLLDAVASVDRRTAPTQR